MKSDLKEFSPGVLGILPLFYIGWSDSVLSPSEVKMIHKQISKMDFLNKEEKDYLIKYSNPANPPSPETFKVWLDELKKYADKISPKEKKNLTELGLDIARAAVDHNADHVWTSPKVYDALREMENHLGIDAQENLTTILHQMGYGQEALPEEKPSFDANKFAKILDGEYYDTKRKIKKLLRDEFFKLSLEPDKETQRSRTLNMLKALAEQGYGSLAFPNEYGGSADMGAYMAVFETLAYHDNSLTVKFGVQFGLFGGAVAGLGTERHHRLYLEPLGRGELLGCFAMTETGHGSNVKGLETLATFNKSDDTITIHSPKYSSGKEYIGNALHGTMAAVFAQLIVDDVNHGVHAVLVPYRNHDGTLLPGIKVEDCGYKMGLNGVDNGRIWFDNVKVPRENLLNKYGDINPNGEYESKISNPNKRFFVMLGALVGGRICVGLAGLNASKTSLSIALKYADIRRQFDGHPNDNNEWLILDYPSHQKRLFPLLAKTIVYYMALTNLVQQYKSAEESDMRKIETKAAGLKAMATWHTTKTIQECREACGGKGYLAENRFVALKADTDIFTTFEGDNTVLLQLVAKGLLTEFKESFHDEGAMAVIRYISKKISISLSELNPISARNTSVEHILSNEFISDALRYREKKLLISLSDRMRSFLGKRLSPFDAFLKCQNHMIELAQAYVERLAYREAMKTYNHLKESAEKTALLTIIQLYGLSCIQENKAFYLENDYMNGSKTKAIRRVINKLYQGIRPNALTYIEAFEIPYESIGADIILNKNQYL